MNFKFPIRYKILAVLSVVVIAAVAVYLYLASRVFYEDKTVLIYELNQNTVRALASDFQADLKRVVDKLKLIAALAANAKSAENLAAAFSDEDELVKVALLSAELPGQAPSRIFVRTWPKYLESYGKDSAYLDHLRDVLPVPFDKVIAKGLWVRNATISEEGSPPLMTVATAVETKSGGNTGMAVIYADVRLDRLLEAVGTGGIAQTYLVDSEGRLLAASDQSRVAQAPDLMADPLVHAGMNSKVRSEVHRYDEGGKSYLGSFFQTGLAGVLVASKVETGAAFAAAERLIRKSLLFALLVVTAAFLVALFFAHSLTKPIQTMLEATHRISKGDFDRLIDIKSHDELATLAASFNSMTTDLRSSRDQIQEYSRDLEKKVLDRTARLEASNVAIKEAQEALVRTTRLASVGEIAGRAAHEVLNPLTNVTARLEKMQSGISKADGEDLKLFEEIVAAWQKDMKEKGAQGMMQALSVPSTAQPGKSLLEEDLENLNAISADISRRLSERRTDLGFLLKEAARISKIVNGMRQLTRVSGNRRPVEIHKILADTLGTMSDVLAHAGIQTETRFCNASPLVLADADELIQVFSNLMRNSMQAIEEGRQSGGLTGTPPKVWVETTRDGGPNGGGRGGGRIKIRICDNGPGIPAENIAQVFESSFTTKPVETGTGLGLSISRRFIRAFDGEIIVEKSVAGVETAFLIELPEYSETT